MICCEEDGSQKGLPPVLLARARSIEAAMPGRLATREDWDIFTGAVGGALPWATTLRMMSAMDEASRSNRPTLVCR